MTNYTIFNGEKMIIQRNLFKYMFKDKNIIDMTCFIIMCLYFFSTGFSALVYQISWNSIFRQTFGVDHYSNTLVVAIFMLGLGLGGYIGSIIVSKFKNYIYIFFIAEIIISIFGYNSDKIIRNLSSFGADLSGSAYGPWPLAVDFTLNLSLLIWPTVLMGASLPIITHYYRNTMKPGTTAGLFYGVNILGATLGSLICGVFFLGNFGISTTLEGISIWNALFSVIMFFLFVYFKVPINGSNSLLNGENYSVKPELGKKLRVKIYLISFAIGFVAIGTEMAFFRLIPMYISNVTYGFAFILSSYLVHMALGVGIVGFAIGRGVSNGALLFFCLIGFIFSWNIYFQIPAFFEIISFIPQFRDVIPENFILGPNSSLFSIITSFFVILPSMLPVLFVSGIFPVLVNIITTDKNKLGKEIGKLYLVQTYGNFLGSVITSFMLFSLIGVINTIFLFSAIMIIMVYLLLSFEEQEWGLFKKKYSKKMFAGSSVTVLVMLFLLTDMSYFYNFTYYKESPVRINETKEGIIVSYDYFDEDYESNKIKVSRINISGGAVTGYAHKDNKKLSWPITPILALMDNTPKRMLLIGIGSGLQAIILKEFFPNIEVVVVELIPEVIDELIDRGSPLTVKTLSDAEIIIGDGKRYLNHTNNMDDIKFDIIQIGVFHVTSPGSGSLFTKETLYALKNRLNDGGVLTTNAYLNSVKAGLNVFEATYIFSRGDAKISDVVYMKKPQLSREEFIERYKITIKNLNKKLDRNGIKQYFNLTAPTGAFVIVNKEKIIQSLHNINAQTDDLPATEYFLSQKTRFGGRYNDSRLWPNRLADIFINDLKN